MDEDLAIAKKMKLWTKVPGHWDPLPDISATEAAVRKALKLSKLERRKWARYDPRDPERIEALTELAASLAALGRDVKRLRGLSQWYRRYDTPGIRSTSAKLQAERQLVRKLLKRGRMS